jgi:hypothetical protein
MSAVLKLTLLFSACFSAVALTLRYEFAVGGISSRGLAVGLACLFVTSFVLIAIFLRSRSTRESVFGHEDADSGSGGAKPIAILVSKTAVALLIVLFLNGVWHIREKPLIPRLVGLGANLFVTFAVVGAVRKLQRGPK